MSSLAGLTRHLSFASGFADTEHPTGVEAGADASGTGMVSIGSGLQLQWANLYQALRKGQWALEGAQPGSPNSTHVKV